MSIYTYMVLIERGKDTYGAYVPDLPGCVSSGDTIEEAIRNIHEAIELHLEGMVAEGLPIPEQSIVAAVSVSTQLATPEATSPQVPATAH